MRRQRIFSFGGVALGAALLMAGPALAEKKYGPGVTDTEIKLGQTMPYSGPASAYGTIGKAETAYFEMINAAGGVNGRKITLVSLDDGYNPAKTVEQTRKLVEQENVLLIFGALGTPQNTATQKYLNQEKIPQLFIATGAAKWDDPSHFPWTMGWQPSYRIEARIYAKYILANKPDAKIGVLYQNDDFGKDYLLGLRDVLGDKTDKIIVSQQSYETSEPTIDSQIVSLQGAGANVFINVATPKFAAQAIHKVAELGWHPLQFVSNVSYSVESVLKPAGLDNSVGIITAVYGKEPSDARWAEDQGFKDYVAWMTKYYPDGKITNNNNSYGYSVAMTMVQVLKHCGDELTRDNAMKQAAHLDLTLPMVLPGMRLTTSPTDYAPTKQMQLGKFDGATWQLFGDLIAGS